MLNSAIKSNKKGAEAPLIKFIKVNYILTFAIGPNSFSYASL